MLPQLQAETFGALSPIRIVMGDNTRRSIEQDKQDQQTAAYEAWLHEEIES